MYKQIFLSSLISALVAALFGYTYTTFYTSIVVDFTESASVLKILSVYLIFLLITGVLYFFMRRILSSSVADFLITVFISLVSIGAVFVVMKMDDPVFKNEDAEIMKDFYKGFLMPLLFMPGLIWLSVKPLMIKS